MTEWETMPLPAEAVATSKNFEAQFGGVYEHSGWVAETVWNRWRRLTGHRFGDLLRAMRDAVDAAPDDTKLELLRAHPELAGEPALIGHVTKSSSDEQRGVGLDQCSPAELEEIRHLNREYSARFGFPFIVAVSGSTKKQIIEAMQHRLRRETEEEMVEAIRQVHRIARNRLEVIASQ